MVGSPNPPGSPDAASIMSGFSSCATSRDIDDMALGPEALMATTLDVYVTFNPAQVTLDSHLDTALEERKVLEEDDRDFIREVVYGTVRYREFIKAFSDSMYHNCRGRCSGNDRDLYAIFTYLITIRLEDLGYIQFRKLVESQDALKMIVWLNYIYNEDFLRGNIRDEWLKVFDKPFVDDVIETLLRTKHKLQDLLDALEYKAYMVKKEKEEADKPFELVKETKTTVIEPFNITQQKPKPLPPPTPKILPPKGKPPPPRKDGPTDEMKAIEAAREINRKKISIKYSNPKHTVKLATHERPMHLPDKLEEAAVQFDEEHPFEPTAHAKPFGDVPDYPEAYVALNTAAILREDALYKKKQEKEAIELLRYEQELRDSSEFDAWKKRMLELDDEARQAEIERVRAGIVATQANAIKARADAVEANLEKGRAAKMEMKKSEARRRAELAYLVELNREKRAAVIEEKAKIAIARERVKQQNAETAEAVRKREAEAARRRAEEAAREEAQRKDLIRQLRALEKAPRKGVKMFDPTETPDHGLLDQMSLVELRERLEFVKKQHAEEEARSRQRILNKRQEKQDTLMAKAANIQRIRKLAHHQAQQRKVATRAESARTAAVTRRKHEADVQKVHDKLAAKRVERAAEAARIAAEEKRVKFIQEQAAAGAAVVEEMKFTELRAGAARELKVRQHTKKAANLTYEATKSKANRVRLGNVAREQKGKRDFVAEYDARLRQLAADRDSMLSADMSKRRSMVASQREFEATARSRVASTAYVPDESSKTPMMEKLKELSMGIAEFD